MRMHLLSSVSVLWENFPRVCFLAKPLFESIVYFDQDNRHPLGFQALNVPFLLTAIMIFGKASVRIDRPR